MGATFAVFKTIGENAKGQHLRLRHGLISGGAVGKYSRQLGHFRQPAPILFALALDAEVHDHSEVRILGFYALPQSAA